MLNKSVQIALLFLVGCASAAPVRHKFTKPTVTPARTKLVEIKLVDLTPDREKPVDTNLDLPTQWPEDLIRFETPHELARFYREVPKEEEEDVFVQGTTSNSGTIKVDDILPTGGVLSFYRAGSFYQGKYAGQEFWLAVYEEAQDGQDCSGSTPQYTSYARMAFDPKNSELTIFPRLNLFYEHRLSFAFKPKDMALLLEKFLKKSVEVDKDASMRLVGMEKPPGYMYIGGVGFKSSEPEFNTRDELWNDIYGDPLSEEKSSEINYLPNSTYGLIYQGEKYNSFFAVLPDGIRIPFTWDGPYEVDEKVDGKDTHYSCHGYFGKGGNAPVAVDAFSELRVSREDLLRKLPSKAEYGNFFVWKTLDQSEPFYEMYEDHFNHAKEYGMEKAGEDNLLNPKEFFSSYPVIIIPTPFPNESIYCERYDFFEPTWVEPVIYLYSKTPTDFRVEPGEEIKFTETKPSLNRAWNVKTAKDGSLWNADDYKSYPYLFWEGKARYNEWKNEGFIVKREDFFSFFRAKLRYLGLNTKEIKDFVGFWSKYIPNETPFYQIRFLDQAEIEKAAPLKVTPEPDTRIRVAVEMRGLTQPFNLPMQVLKPGPKRHGKVLVEWGVIPR